MSRIFSYFAVPWNHARYGRTPLLPPSYMPVHIFHYNNVLYRLITTQTNRNTVNLIRRLLNMNNMSILKFL